MGNLQVSYRKLARHLSLCISDGAFIATVVLAGVAESTHSQPSSRVASAKEEHLASGNLPIETLAQASTADINAGETRCDQLNILHGISSLKETLPQRVLLLPEKLISHSHQKNCMAIFQNDRPSCFGSPNKKNIVRRAPHFSCLQTCLWKLSYGANIWAQMDPRKGFSQYLQGSS